MANVTVAELRALAMKYNIDDYSKMKKAELMAVLEGKIDEKNIDVGNMDKELKKARKEADKIVKEVEKNLKKEFAKLVRENAVGDFEKDAEKAIKNAKKEADKAFAEARKVIVAKYM